MSDENLIQQAIKKIRNVLNDFEEIGIAQTNIEYEVGIEGVFNDILNLLSAAEQQMVCPKCKGKGGIGEDEYIEGRNVGQKECPACNGTGTLLAAYKVAEERIESLQFSYDNACKIIDVLDKQIADLEEVLRDERRLSKELSDFLAPINGTENPSLCDVVTFVKNTVRKLRRQIVEKYERIADLQAKNDSLQKDIFARQDIDKQQAEKIANLQAEIEQMKEPNGTAKGEFMHESIEKDAVQYDLPEEEIIQALCQDNKLLKKQLAEKDKLIEHLVDMCKKAPSLYGLGQNSFEDTESYHQGAAKAQKAEDKAKVIKDEIGIAVAAAEKAKEKK